jgi:hypothetical protein
MELVHALGIGTRETERALRFLVALVILGVLAYGVILVAASAGHDGRCQDLLTSDGPSDYISFEVEGCRAQVEDSAVTG